MLNKISTQIENINHSLAWIKDNHPEDYENRFLQLVEERRKLRSLLRAERENPGIAAYGISQVGKSYLINNILQKDGQPFTVEADGTKYRFIEQMNPETRETEATGVVTRFSSFKRCPSLYSKKYPIMMRCLSVKDVALVLCEGYYNDINDYSTYKEETLNDEGEKLFNRFCDRPHNPAAPIKAEDVLEIKSYITRHINNAQNISHTTYLDRLALVVERIPLADLTSVLSILWHNCEPLTRVFNKMLSTLERLEFSEYVYLPASALLHGGFNENTIVSVQCLNELFIEQPRYFTDVYLRRDDTFTQVEALTKSEVCAVCAEIVVKIADDFLEHSGHYCFDGVDSSLRAELGNGEVKMDILRDNDLLDFPGARSRKKEQSDTLCEDQILINVLLRGKVAYLFNMYNESRLINILIYCHHYKQNEVTDIPLLLRNWIRTYVGDSIEKRQHTLHLTDGISPFFYVATMFNVDMKMEAKEDSNSENSLHGRWQQRFSKVLYHQCFNADGCVDSKNEKIFLNWTRKGEIFRNSYLLRDYKYSGPHDSKLYEHETDPDVPTVRTIPEPYYQLLRSTFCSNEHVQRFFSNPALSWDLAATPNNDGALYIIQNLSKVAKRMDATRESQFADVYRDSVRKIMEIMSDYYTSTDVGEMLDANVKKARAIKRELSFTCNADNYFFGHLIQSMQYNEKAASSLVHHLLVSPTVVTDVNDWSQYELIINDCEEAGFPLDKCRNVEEKWQAIIETYGFFSKEEAQDYMKSREVDINILFNPKPARKLNSYVIADAVFGEWCRSIRSVDFLNKVTTGTKFDPIVMNYLVEDMVHCASDVKLSDHMAESIAEFVNVVNTQAVNEYLVTDILVSTVNDFVLDLGYRYLSSDAVSKARSLCEGRKLPVHYLDIEEHPSTPAELVTMFDDMASKSVSILPSFKNNFGRWVEYLYISFVSHLDVPEDFDIEANNALKRLLGKIRENQLSEA